MQVNIKIARIVKMLLYVHLLFLAFGCDLEKERQEYAEMIIQKAEKFKAEVGRLPKDGTEIGLKELENSPAVYQRTTESTYIVWYLTTFGETKIYRSATKTWVEER